MLLVRPILEYGAACWDTYRERQISSLDRVQKKAAKFAHHTRSVRKLSDRIFLCEHLMDYNLARLHEPTLNLSAHA